MGGKGAWLQSTAAPYHLQDFLVLSPCSLEVAVWCATCAPPTASLLGKTASHRFDVQVSTEPAAGGDGETIDADVVLVCVGRREFRDGLGVEDVGVALDGKKIKVDESFKTSVPNIYVPHEMGPRFGELRPSGTLSMGLCWRTKLRMKVPWLLSRLAALRLLTTCF